MSVRLDAKTEQVVRALARRTRRTTSQVIRDAIHRLATAESEAGRGQTVFDLWKDAIGCAQEVLWTFRNAPDIGSARSRSNGDTLRSGRRE